MTNPKTLFTLQTQKRSRQILPSRNSLSLFLTRQSSRLLGIEVTHLTPGTKFIETQKPILVGPENKFTAVDEAMSILTQLSPDEKDTSKFKEKSCVLKLLEVRSDRVITLSQIQFNLLDFLALDPNQLLKLDFKNCIYPETRLIVQVTAHEEK